jgi:predicted SprT family Zn-dependent metalloprotease
MKELNEIYKKGRAIVEECCGPVIGNIFVVKTNSRAMARWGRCDYHRGYNTYSIQISKRILADEVPYEAVLSTMIHEILHTCQGAEGHGAVWQQYARQVMRKHPELKITRTTPASAFGLGEEQAEFRQKYAIKCEKCGMTHYSSKLSRSIQHPERYRCGHCGGKMVRAK